MTISCGALAREPSPGAEAALRIPSDGGGFEERHYSVWRSDAAKGTLDVCVVLHGLGAGSRWAARCRAGDELELSLPRALPIALDDSAREHVFLGDETSIASADALMRALPAGAPRLACFELGSGDRRWPDAELADPAAVRWLACGARPGAALLAWLESAELPPPSETTAYVTGEAWLCAVVQSSLVRERRFSPRSVRAFPYWKRRPSAAVRGSEADPPRTGS
ncbi:MAG TPA: siderophore-interacting protein [Thermoanaerobaculia bacterium]|nr:siderophore-interacting protein [Thermoanaerobaculia bacterium]